MIKLTAQLGSNPLRYHTPIKAKLANQHFFTSGENGEIVAWAKQSLNPLYLIVSSALADTDGLIDFIVSPVRLIINQITSLKIITIHNDDRARIFSSQDGLCLTISQHALFPEKILGLVENEHESRFFFCFGQRIVYIVDSWSMKIIDQIQPKIQSYSVIKKGRINEKKQLQVMDKQSKTYRLNISHIFEEINLDVGGWVSNPAKAGKKLYQSIEKIKAQTTVTSYRKLVDPDLTEQIKGVNLKIQEIKKSNIWEDILDRKYEHMQVVKYFFSLGDEEPVVSNCFFIKNSRLWYFFGTNKGRIIGVPAVMVPNQQILVSTSLMQVDSPVAYMSFFQNLLIVSWQNGTFRIFTMDNLDYTIQTSLSAKKNKMKNQMSEDPYPNLCIVDLNHNKVVSQKLSAQIKYRLEIYSLNRGKLGTNLLAFQLMNNQVIVFESLYRLLSHYRGISQNLKIYAVIQIQDYFGIAHNNGIDVYSADRYERTITYDNWTWTDFQLCEGFNCKQDYHNIFSRKHGSNSQTEISQINGNMMFEHFQRFYRKKIDYCIPTLDLLYQTFGPISAEQITNQQYPQINFIQKVYSERTIHSSSSQSATSVIRLKHSNVRRQKLTNTTYLYSCNLNKQLEIFMNDKQIPLSLKSFQSNLSVFSLFFWDQDQGIEVGEQYNKCKYKFILKRRLTQQGIGRTFTIYFQNKYRTQLSPQLLTYTSIATVALLQVCSSKDISLADQMVNAVEYYTVHRNENQLKVDVETLSRLSITESHQILKACINILMSTALTQIVPLHPVNDYFLLNLKNMEEKNSILLSETETIWFVYLGIGFIYSNAQCDQDQVKKLIQRLIKAIDIKNFELKPDLIQIVLKVFNQGIKKWKKLILPNIAMKLYADLFKIFFYYDGLNGALPDDKKFNFVFENVPVNENKKMKLQIVKTIIYLSKQFNNQFLQVIRIQALNQKSHLAYPSSVIQILRQYIKNEKPKINLVFYIELLLQCLSPMTPQLRKYVQKNVLATLQLMCSYENISFNQPSQKLSLRTDSNIYIYCLRTSTKWRTIPLKDQKNTQNSIIEMSPQGTYIALLGDKLRIWRLSSGFWSGVLGAFSQGWVFDAEGKDIKWDQKEQSITVINENPSLNKCYKL